MKNLRIKFTGISHKTPTILIDDKESVLKKNQFGSYEHNIQTEKDSVNVKVQTYLEINGGLWFLVNMFFFIISIFGIFDYRLPKNCIIISFEANIKLTEENNEVLLNFLPQAKDSPACEIKGNSSANVEIVSNSYLEDAEAKRRMKKLRVWKWILFLSCLAIIVVVLLSGVIVF